jgi:hypothetical protein
MIARAVMLLPEPLSPTSARISPWRTSSAIGFGGFRHEGFRDFHHRFDRRFAFGFGGFPGYGDYAYDDGCLRREWGPYGWRLVNICY